MSSLEFVVARYNALVELSRFMYPTRAEKAGNE
jgi:hypothetical protein